MAEISTTPAPVVKRRAARVYKPEMAATTYKLCLLGATNVQIADILGVSLDSVIYWTKKYPEFAKALEEGKAIADSKVADALYHRALGYKHEAVKIVVDAKSGAEVQVPYIEHYPPDTTACIFWLKNRRRDKWRDNQDVNHSGGVAVLQLVIKKGEK